MTKKIVAASDPKVVEKIEWICERVKALRTANGITQKQLGTAIGCSRERVSETERKRYKDLQISTVCRISQALGMSLQAFFSGCPGEFPADCTTTTG